MLRLAGGFSTSLRIQLTQQSLTTLPCGPLRILITRQLRFWYNFHSRAINEECHWEARLPLKCWEACIPGAFHDWEDQFLHKFSSTDIPVLGSFKWLFPESRASKSPISCSVHNSNPASRPLFTLNSRIPAFK